jgi:hypothetical protein
MHIRLGINPSVDKMLYNYIPHVLPTGALPNKVIIKDAYCTFDEITFPASYWDEQLAQMNRNGGISLVFQSYSNTFGTYQTTESYNYMLSERRLYLNYLLFAQINDDDQRQPLNDVPAVIYVNDDTTSTLAPTEAQIQRIRPDALQRFQLSRLAEYDVRLNNESYVDGKIVVYDSETPLVTEAYNEVNKVVKLIGNGSSAGNLLRKFPISAKDYVKSKFLIGCAFTTNDSAVDDDEGFIDGANNTQRTGQIVVKTLLRKSKVAPASSATEIAEDAFVKNYFAVVNYTAILNIKANSTLEVIQ